MQIHIADEQTECLIDHKKIKNQIRNILIALECENIEISILLTDDKKIQELNKMYRRQNKPTDVLAFPQKRI